MLGDQNLKILNKKDVSFYTTYTFVLRLKQKNIEFVQIQKILIVKRRNYIFFLLFLVDFVSWGELKIPLYLCFLETRCHAPCQPVRSPTFPIIIICIFSCLLSSIIWPTMRCWAFVRKPLQLKQAGMCHLHQIIIFQFQMERSTIPQSQENLGDFISVTF